MISKGHRRFQAAYLGLSENNVRPYSHEQKETAKLCLDHRLLEVVVAKIPHAVRHENNISIERAKVFQECLAADVQNKSLYNLLTTQYIIYTVYVY